jgi:hypothetical protein
MNIKWLHTLALSGFLTFIISHNVIAMEDSRENEWDKVIQTKVPFGRQQLEKYKEIYGKHQGSLKEPVEDLGVPLCWAYANAYSRLKNLEEKDFSIKERLGEAPTVALRQLFEEHELDPSKPLSRIEFEEKVMDVVGLLDLCFHPDEKELSKKNLKEVFEKKNKGAVSLFLVLYFLKNKDSVFKV